MNENLYILTNYLLNNEDKAKQFANSDSPDEFYNFAKLLDVNCSREEFDDYMIELSKLNFLCDNNHIEDDSFEDVVGGRILDKSWGKIICSIICSSIAVSSQFASAAPNFNTGNDSNVQISQKENGNHIWNLAKDLLSKYKDSILLGSSSALIIGAAVSYVNKEYNNPSTIPGVGGLYNVRNSCYLNSALQQLYRIDRFKDIILSQDGISSVSHPITCAVKEIFLSMVRNEPISKDRMTELAIILQHDFNQKDSIDRMSWIVDSCENELGINSILRFDRGVNLYGCYPGENLVKIIIDQADVDRIAVREYIINNIPGIADLSNADIAQEVINFIGNNDVSDFTKIDIETNFNNNIIMPIHRGVNVGEKISININIPTMIDTQNDFDIENGGNYYLSGATIHHGNSRGGHYFVYERLPSGKWIRISDSWVSGELDYSQVKEDIEKNAVLLVFSKN